MTHVGGKSYGQDPLNAILVNEGLGGEECLLTNDEACEAASWVIRTLLLPLLEAGW